MVNRINPKVRAYGKARLDITMRARNEEEWLQGWHDALYEFPFQLSNGWRFGFEYKVEDFAAEIGFFLDQLGFPVDSFSPSYARFTTPDQEFIFSVAQALDGESSTPPETVRLHLQVLDLDGAVSELESRGIEFDQEPIFLDSRSSMVATFRSPHGISIDLWQYIDQPYDPYEEDELEGDPQDEEVYQNEVLDRGLISSAEFLEVDDSDEEFTESYEDDPVEGRFQESKKNNYRLWDEDEEEYDAYSDEETEDGSAHPLIFKSSGNKDEFLDRLLKETSDRQDETEITDDSGSKPGRVESRSTVTSHLTDTRSVLRSLRENQNKISRNTISPAKFTARRSQSSTRNSASDGTDDGDEAYSEEELIYQEIDETDMDYSE